MPSRSELPPPKLEVGCDVEVISAHMAASLGLEKAQSVVGAAIAALALPAKGKLSAQQTHDLLTRLATEPGLVGIAAKVARQMLRHGVAPQKPAF